MKFKKKFLLDTLYGNDLIEFYKITGKNRMVFKFEGKFYSSDESPYEYADDEDEIECPEVVPVEKTVIVYEPEKEIAVEINKPSLEEILTEVRKALDDLNSGKIEGFKITRY